jgi:signal transduction histidine kinase/ligand-binding sensor domain-containing protein
MEIDYSKIKFISIALVLMASCKSVTRDIPFPKYETEFAQPVSKHFVLTEPVKWKWNTVNLKKFRPIVHTKIDLDKIPVRPFDTSGFRPFTEPSAQIRFRWDSVPFKPFNIQALPSEKYKFRTTILGIPKVVKRRVPQGYSGAKSDISMVDDLPDSKITALLYCHDGILWVAIADFGICRIDGEYISIYGREQGLVNIDVNMMSEDNQGQIWLGTYKNGVEVLDLKSGSARKISKNEGLSSNSISCLMADKTGQIWIGTSDSGIDIIDEQSGTLKHLNSTNGLNENYVRSFLQESTGDIWIGTEIGIDIIKYGYEKIKHVDLFSGQFDNYIECLLEKKKNEIWIGTSNGINIWDKNLGIVKHFDKRQGLKSNFIKEFVIDHCNQIWILEQQGGIDILNDREDLFRHISARDIITENNVTAIAKGSKDLVWIGTNPKGLLAFNETESVKYFNTSLSEDFGVRSFGDLMEDSRGLIWLTADKEVLIIDLRANTVRKLNLHHEVFSFFEDSQGKIWMNTVDNGVYILNPKDGTISNISTAQGLSSNYVFGVFEDNSHRIWVGGYPYSVSSIDLQLNTISSLDLGSEIKNLDASDFMEDTDGQIWIPTFGQGTFILNSKSDKFRRIFDSTDVYNNSIVVLYRDTLNRIWMGHPGEGLSVMNLGDSFITNMSLPNGLGENQVLSVSFIGNEIYYLTNIGLTRIEHTSNDINRSVHWELKAIKTTRMGSNFPNITYPFVLRKRGEFWWILGDHITVMKPGKNDPQEPKTRLTGIDIKNTTQYFVDKTNGLNVDNLKWDSLAGPYNIPVNLKLPYNMNMVSFHFTSLESDNLDNTVYRCFLKGRDKKWSDISDKSFSQSYIDLQPEDYVFKVASRSINGVWGTPEEFRFTILPPWWKTWLAYLSYFIFILSFAYFIYRNNLRRFQTRQRNQIKAAIQTQEDERKRISRDLHDDIGTKLSALKLFLSSLEEKAMATNNKEIGTMAQISEQYIKEVVNDLRQLLMNLSPLVLEEFGYVVAVEGLANKINETNLIQFTLNVFGFKQRMQKEYELYLYRITQELISNILKHADARNISLQVGIRDEKIILIMADDGRGFNVNELNGGYGLKNLETRTKIMSGKMTIESNPGNGTNVLIEIPYNLS